MVRLARSGASAHHRPMDTERRRARRIVAILGTLALLFSLGAVGATAQSVVVLKPIASGFDSPVFVTNAHDGSGRLFVVEQTGKIKVVQNGVVRPTPFLDISDLVSKGTEQGLLGLAFHPSYKTNGYFFVDFTGLTGATVIYRYKVSPTDPNVALRSSATKILIISQPYANHNGGMIAFGRDGDLYIGMGDGGSSGDPGNRAQSIGTMLGKILRININGSLGTRHYLMPAGNPYIGRTGLDEIWSRGLRNPWRFSFDRLTGDLWIGDVGQARFEEIDRSLAPSSGLSPGRNLNYGWRIMEGAHCYSPPTGCNRTGLVMPVVEYNHTEGCAVTGGYVYRGSQVPAIGGHYVFGDFCSGKIWMIPRTGGLKGLLFDTSMQISSFGEDESGELYVVDHAGAIYKFQTR
jgi:glucose/arabinose dehydrogenase